MYVLLQHSPKFLINILKGLLVKNFRLCTVSHCAESNFSNFEFEYLRENKFLSKTILACLSGAQMSLIHEKNRGRKSCDTASLSRHFADFNSKKQMSRMIQTGEHII